MKNWISCLLCFIVLACASTKQMNYVSPFKGFQFVSATDTIELIVNRFVKNDFSCFTEGIPYALIIGTTNWKVKSKTVSILAKCDNNTYRVGQALRVVPVEDPTLKTSLKPIYFKKDSLVNGQRFTFLVGSEFPAIWGKVVK